MFLTPLGLLKKNTLSIPLSLNYYALLIRRID